MGTSTVRHAARRPGDLNLGSIVDIDVDEIQPSEENNHLYRPVDPEDPSIVRLAENIREVGLQEPLHLTADHFIVSGHRRYVAARLAGMDKIPCRMYPWRKDDNHDKFMRYLTAHNIQRVKTNDELLHEEIVSANPDEAYRYLTEHRRKKATITADSLAIEGASDIRQVSVYRQMFLKAVLRVLDELKDFLPLSIRRIHYHLLNDPPLTHTSKPKSWYSNTNNDYKKLGALLRAARNQGCVPMDAIDDPTRPVFISKVYNNPQRFMQITIDGFLKGYYRDLMQSQPNHIEILTEKNTVAPILKPVALDYCIPITSGRGYCSWPPLRDMARRYRKSGRQQLILIVISDFDPEGEDIPHTAAALLRDVFHVTNITLLKAALTAQQIREKNLHSCFDAKKQSTRYKTFVERHGTAVYELEALDPYVLQQLLRDTIDSVIDRDAYNREIDREKEDSQYLYGIRKTMQRMLADVQNNS